MITNKLTLKYYENAQIESEILMIKMTHRHRRKIMRSKYMHGIKLTKVRTSVDVSQLDIRDIKCCPNDERRACKKMVRSCSGIIDKFDEACQKNPG